MSATTIFQLSCSPCIIPRNTIRHSNYSICPVSLNLPRNRGRNCLKLAHVEPRYKKAATVCLFGGEGKPKNEASPWKALEKAVGNLKKDKSIEDVLRDQIEKQEFFDEGGGSGGKRPGGGGGGGGNGEPSGDESFSEMVDEIVQFVLATMAFIFLYMYIIEGEEINVLTKDLIRLLFTGQRSIRLRRLINDWKDFLEQMKEEEEEPYWLERAIFETSTNYDSRAKYEHIIRNHPDMLMELLEDPTAPVEEQNVP